MDTMEALTYDQYLDTLPADRRTAIDRVWRVIRQHVPAGYEEQIDRKSLQFAAGADEYVALANQKNYVSLYLIPAYVEPTLKHKLDAVDKKLKMGKSCLNFTDADELPLDIIGEIVSAFTPDEFLQRMARSRTSHRA